MTRTSLPQLPALVVGRVRHSRRVPVRHAFAYRSYQWLVDLDALPRLPWWLRPLAGFRASDHLAGGRSGGIRGDLTELLASEGFELAEDDRVLMLANARTLGHVFNPLSVFWVLREAAGVVAVVLEVHNTYGQRHSYVLEVDENGRAEVDKAFYVSPFNDVRGRYTVRVQLSAEQVGVMVGLDRDGHRILTASSWGVPQAATPRSVVRVGLTHLLMPQRVSILIRLHGVWLWLRRLPIHARTSAEVQPKRAREEAHA